MKLYDKFGYKKAITVDEKVLIELDECIRKYFSSPQYKAQLLDGSSIVFESLEELLAYDNVGKKSFMYLNVDFGYSNSLEFKPSISWVHSYGYSVSAEYVTKEKNDSILFKEELYKIMEKGKRSRFYTFITKVSMFYFLCIVAGLGIGLFGTLFLLGVNTTSSTVVTMDTINMWCVSAFLILLISYILSSIRKRIFPVISFKLGDGIKVVERLNDLRSKCFWGVIVAGIVSVITGKIL